MQRAAVVYPFSEICQEGEYGGHQARCRSPDRSSSQNLPCGHKLATEKEIKWHHCRLERIEKNQKEGNGNETGASLPKQNLGETQKDVTFYYRLFRRRHIKLYSSRGSRIHAQRKRPALGTSTQHSVAPISVRRSALTLLCRAKISP